MTNLNNFVNDLFQYASSQLELYKILYVEKKSKKLEPKICN